MAADVAATAAEKVPMAHGVHATEPAAGSPYVPAGHCSGAAVPAAAHECPAGHAEHDCVPRLLLTAEYVPGEHGMGSARPLDGACCPEAGGVGVDEPAGQ